MRILLVRDEPAAARRVKRVLQTQGFDVEVTSDAATMEALRAGVYDLLILDAPDRASLMICRNVRTAGITVPILVLSSRRRVADRVKGLDAGADDYLTKPLATSELTAHVRALLRRNGGPAIHPIVVGDLRLDPVTRQVSRGRRRIDLTSKEFALLEYLMRHAGQPLSRSMIAEHVWGVRWDRLTNVIDVFISHLRKKVDLPGDRRLLQAVRGVGYVIGRSGRGAVLPGRTDSPGRYSAPFTAASPGSDARKTL
ncbi:MAG TPA: response regulator transcription factor [Vicinamibacterales bacterium]|nr:response regulator transcription factor [Vicinamibacterales bacterium]